MSESYTIGGDTLHKIDNENWQGQTFSPLKTHKLQFIDLEMRGAMFANQPVVQVLKADENHHPTGPTLSRNRVITEKKSGVFTTGRVRFSMQAYDLIAGQYYVILVQNPLPLLGNSAWWQYDQGDATYPRGIRISSSDSGQTWTDEYNDDFMFVEWGAPPSIKPVPPPPIENFAPVAINYFHRPASITITLSTATPCHLTCYYTDKKPLKHHTSRTVRGITVPWGTYFCFVAWTPVRQAEDGDTLYHTFEIPDWQFCQTKWLTFRGTVDEVLSPSIGPIFQHHHQGIGERTFQQPLYDATWFFGAVGTAQAGQRLFIENRRLTSFGFWAQRTAHPLDEVNYIIRRIDPPGIIFSKRMNNALFSPSELRLIEAQVDPPLPINFEVYLLIEHRRVFPGPRLGLAYWNADIVPDQNFVAMVSGTRLDYPDQECAYAYSWE